MNQILGLRPVFNEKKQKWDMTDATFFRRGWRVKSIPELFKNLEQYLAPIPAQERYNLYYTVAFCAEGKREFREQSVLVFDIDHIKHGLEDSYIKAVCFCLGVQAEATGIVASGNGLHFIIGLNAPIIDPLFFDKNRRHYNALCEKIKAALVKADLPGDPDPAVFDARRIMRLPGTENRKEGKETKHCRLLQPTILEIPYDLAEASGLPVVAAADQINAEGLKKYPKPDTAAILDGCDFLKWCKESPASVHENQWYGMLSVLPRLPPNGRDLAHEYSAGHPGYSHTETEAKIDQALAASGPRTCANFDKLWGKCQGCKNFGKVTSPIMIQGAGYIKTASTGFHDVYVDDKGNVKPGKPNYEDLRKFFEAEHPYLILGGSRICLVWTGTHWTEMPDGEIDAYAQKHFNPIADNKKAAEFKGVIFRTNLRDPSWFVETTNRKINFSNGVLNLDTMEFGPHSTEIGFRYVLEYAYEPQAQAPTFAKFLLDIMDNRRELVDVLLEFAGYSFSGDECWAQKGLIMTGDGSNGKSTFMDVLKKLAGKDNSSSLTLKDINTDTARKLLDGKLFNLAEETPTYAMMESSLFKNLVSGGETTVKTLYKQPYSIVNKAKFMFACNELPKTRDTTRGYFRRLLIVPFDRRFEGSAKDPFIKTKLFTELPGVFNLVIQGYRRLKERQEFTRAVAMDKQIEDYRTELDTVKSWYDDCVEAPGLLEPLAATTVNVPLSALYSAYQIYCEAKGEKPETSATMARRLSRVMTDYKGRWNQSTIDGRREVHFRGVKYAGASQY